MKLPVTTVSKNAFKNHAYSFSDAPAKIDEFLLDDMSIHEDTIWQNHGLYLH